MDISRSLYVLNGEMYVLNGEMTDIVRDERKVEEEEVGGPIIGTHATALLEPPDVWRRILESKMRCVGSRPSFVLLSACFKEMCKKHIRTPERVSRKEVSRVQEPLGLKAHLEKKS
jgi:hypothetical protein